jgi:hypothetical protein
MCFRRCLAPALFVILSGVVRFARESRDGVEGTLRACRVLRNVEELFDDDAKS